VKRATPYGAFAVLAFATACGAPQHWKDEPAPVVPDIMASRKAQAERSASEPEPPPPAPAEPASRGKRIAARHVLIQYIGAERASSSVVRTKDQARTLAEEIRKRAAEGEDLGRLAVDYSDEPNAAQRGGSLGRFGRGQMVPAFENAAFALEVGQISQVVETSFGFHVIERTE
jgi:hypothetical protein